MPAPPRSALHPDFAPRSGPPAAAPRALIDAVANAPRSRVRSAQHSAQRGLAAAARNQPLVAGTFGFVAGALFWHFVGFWSLVSSAVFAPPQQQTRAAAEQPKFANASPIETGSLQRLERLTAKKKLEADCTAISRDPISSRVVQNECPKLQTAFGTNTASERQDRERPRITPLPAASIATAATTPTIAATDIKLDQDIPLDWSQRR